MDGRQDNQEPRLEQDPEREGRPDPSQLSAIERLYEHFRRVPLRYLDIFIWVCVAALVFVVAMGVVKARSG